MVRGVLTFCAFIFWSGPAWAHNFRVCEALLSSEQTALKFHLQLKKLNPTVFASPLSDLESLYLSVKGEEWVYASIPLDRPPRLKPLPEDLKRHLISEFSDSHRLDINNDEEMTRFYVNALRGVYSRVGDRIRAQRAAVNLAYALTYDEQVIFESLMAGFWFPKRLQDQDLSPDQAQRVLNDQAWTKYPWQGARDLLQAWDASGLKFSRRDFMRWSESFAGKSEMSRDHIERLAAAIDLANYSRHPICCVSTPGCHDCPLNRRTLRNSH